MISMEAWTTIRYLRVQGRGIKAIARELGVSRNTVRLALEREGPPHYQRPPQPNPKLEPYREFIAFMHHLLRNYPSGELHVILDNVSSHDSKEVQEWHKRPRNKRVVFHFIPTYSSWLNLAEVLFNLLQAKVLRRGVFPSKQALVTAIMDYIEKFNAEGHIFQWTKTAQTIISSSNNLTGH